MVQSFLPVNVIYVIYYLLYDFGVWFVCCCFCTLTYWNYWLFIMITQLNEIPLYSPSLGLFMPVILLHALSSLISIPTQFSLSIIDIMWRCGSHCCFRSCLYNINILTTLTSKQWTSSVIEVRVSHPLHHNTEDLLIFVISVVWCKHFLI